MINTFLSRFLTLILFLMPFMAPIWITENHFHVEQSYLKMALGVIASLIILLFWTFVKNIKSEINFQYSSVLLFFTAFLIWEFVGLFWVVDTHAAIVTLIQHSSFVVVFFLALNLFYKKDFPIVLNTLVVSMTIVSAVGLAQYYINDPFIQNLFFQKAFPAATFVNKNMASHFIVMTLPISLVMFVFAKNKYFVALYSVAFYIGFMYLLYTGARQAYVAIMAQFVVLALFFGLDLWKNKERSIIYTFWLKKIKIFALLLIVSFISLTLNFSQSGLSNKDTTQILQRIDSINLEGGGSRIPLWVNTIEMIKDHPVQGVGVNQWFENYPLYYDSVVKDVAFNERTQLQRVHNDYLETFASVGLVGYMFLLLSLFVVVRYAVTILSHVDHPQRMVVLASILGALGFLVVAFFSFPIESYLPVYLLMIFIVFVVKSFNETTFSIKDKYYLSSILVIIALIFSSNFIYKLIMAEYYYMKSIEPYNKGDFDKGLKYMSVSTDLNPNIWRHNNMKAIFLMKKSRFNEAIKLLKKANKFSPYNTVILHNLQESYARIGDIKQQTSILKKILEIDSLNVKASSILVRAFYIQKMYKEATAEYKRTKKNFEYFKGRPGFGPYHTSLAETSLLVGDYKYFGYIYEDLIANDPKAEHYVVYGVVEYQRVGDKDNAKKLFNKALEIDQTIDIPREIRIDLDL